MGEANMNGEVQFFIFITLGGHNNLNSIPFFMIFSAPYAPIEGVNFFETLETMEPSPWIWHALNA